MKRGCSKEPVGTTTADVEGFSNVKSTTTVCGSSSCNKSVGKAENMVVALSAGSVGGSTDVEEPAEGSTAAATTASFVVSLSALMTFVRF